MLRWEEEEEEEEEQEEQKEEGKKESGALEEKRINLFFLHSLVLVTKSGLFFFKSRTNDYMTKQLILKSIPRIHNNSVSCSRICFSLRTV